MNKWKTAALKRKQVIEANEANDEKATDLDIIVTEVLKLPYGQLKKVLTEPVMAVLEKYGYTE